MFTVGNVYIDRYIGRRSGQHSIATRPTLGRLSTDSRSTIDREVVDSRSSVNRYSVDRAINHRPSLNRVSTPTSTEIAVDITYSKHDPSGLGVIN